MEPSIIPLLQKCGSFWQAREVFCNIEISHASNEGSFRSILLFHPPPLLYPEPTKGSEAFSLQENLTGTTDKGETLSRITVPIKVTALFTLE